MIICIPENQNAMSQTKTLKCFISDYNDLHSEYHFQALIK
jgi:hypothetical protein